MLSELCSRRTVHVSPLELIILIFVIAKKSYKHENTFTSDCYVQSQVLLEKKATGTRPTYVHTKALSCAIFEVTCYVTQPCPD